MIYSRTMYLWRSVAEVGTRLTDEYALREQWGRPKINGIVLTSNSHGGWCLLARQSISSETGRRIQKRGSRAFDYDGDGLSLALYCRISNFMTCNFGFDVFGRCSGEWRENRAVYGYSFISRKNLKAMKGLKDWYVDPFLDWIQCTFFIGIIFFF